MPFMTTSASPRRLYGLEEGLLGAIHEDRPGHALLVRQERLDRLGRHVLPVAHLSAEGSDLRKEHAVRPQAHGDVGPALAELAHELLR